jgi:hypothetical protein
MAVKQEPRNGLWYDWVLGDDNWHTNMNGNLKKVGLLLYLSAVSRAVSTPPGTPTDGDAYIVGPAATGLWAGHEDDVAVWVSADSAWTFYAPHRGFAMPVEDENAIVAWDGSAWHSGIPLDHAWEAKISRLSVLDRDLTAPPGSPSVGDAYVPAATATGDWAGHEDEVAVWWQSPGEGSPSWHFHTPETGLRAYIVDEDVFSLWDGAAWTPGLAV